jgi:hypothetical protein
MKFAGRKASGGHSLGVSEVTFFVDDAHADRSITGHRQVPAAQGRRTRAVRHQQSSQPGLAALAIRLRQPRWSPPTGLLTSAN